MKEITDFVCDLYFFYTVEWAPLQWQWKCCSSKNVPVALAEPSPWMTGRSALIKWFYSIINIIITKAVIEIVLLKGRTCKHFH